MLGQVGQCIVVEGGEETMDEKIVWVGLKSGEMPLHSFGFLLMHFVVVV